MSADPAHSRVDHNPDRVKVKDVRGGAEAVAQIHKPTTFCHTATQPCGRVQGAGDTFLAMHVHPLRGCQRHTRTASH